ncbi:MAG: transcriptional regulator NrdR [Candidatus Woesearchaeota archaeon]
MRCPYCLNSDTKVIDKREISEESVTRRRRECLKCSKRFTSYERIETSNIIVVKKDGKKEQFSREKLKKGFLKACHKRPVPEEKISEAMDRIEAELFRQESSEIPSKALGNLVMKHLKRLDKVAYIRFASVYKDFADVEDFSEELSKLIKKR